MRRALIWSLLAALLICGCGRKKRARIALAGRIRQDGHKTAFVVRVDE